MKRENPFIFRIFGYLALFKLCAADRGAFGDACNKTNRCVSSLSCIENKCQCLMPSEMVYDEQWKRCEIMAGGNCSFTDAELSEETRMNGMLVCVENAACDGEHCSCEPNWYDDTLGNCRRKRINGEQCNSDKQCREDLNLKCENGLCSCYESEAVVLNGRCVARVGVSCMKYEGRCVPNAECFSFDTMCTCRSGYEKSTDDLCLVSYGSNCDADTSPCKQSFSCFDGICGCHFPQHQVYDQSMDQCFSYSQGPCLEHVNGNAVQFPCVSNAECKVNDNISECTCNDGYIHSVGRQCSLTHRQPCYESKSCDILANLVCKNGRCRCQDYQIYDAKRSLCIGVVGAECSINDNFCDAGASCQSKRFNFRDWQSINRKYETSGSCRCLETHVSTPERRCVLRDPNENVLENVLDAE